MGNITPPVLQPLVGTMGRRPPFAGCATRPAHDGQARGVGHGDETKDAEGNVRYLVKPTGRHASVVEQGL